MSETPWQLLGRLARSRRERLGLGQGDLAAYGGPKVSTVGKIERAAQDNYPPRTQHQLENALGWKRDTVRDILAAQSSTWWDDDALRIDFENSLVEDNIPDLSRPIGADSPRRAGDLTDEELAAEVTYRLRRYADELRAREDQEDEPRDAAPMTPAGDDPADEDRRSPVELYLVAHGSRGADQEAALRELERRQLPANPIDLVHAVQGVLGEKPGNLVALPAREHEQAALPPIVVDDTLAARKVTRKGYGDQDSSE